MLCVCVSIKFCSILTALPVFNTDILGFALNNVGNAGNSNDEVRIRDEMRSTANILTFVVE